MKNHNRSKQKHHKKQPFNMYVWGQRYKKVFAAIICFVLVLGLLASLIQV